MPVVNRPVVYRVTVPENLAGERLDKALAILLPDLSRRRHREILNRGGVWELDQRIAHPARTVRAGQELTILHPEDFVYPSLQIEQRHVLWEDSDLIAINKEAGWYVQPTAWDRFGNVEAALIAFFQGRWGKPPKLHLLHRLDRETSGVLIVSKTGRVNGPMQRLWSEGKVNKRYRFLCRGEVPEKWSCNEPLGPGPGGKYRIDAVKGKAAQTDFARMATSSVAGDIFSEAEAIPLTGRTHQIRIHATCTGFPILGDTRYDGPDVPGAERTMLHAAALRFTHPFTGKSIELEARPPEDYRRLAASLGLDDK